MEGENRLKPGTQSYTVARTCTDGDAPWQATLPGQRRGRGGGASKRRSQATNWFWEFGALCRSVGQVSHNLPVVDSPLMRPLGNLNIICDSSSCSVRKKHRL